MFKLQLLAVALIASLALSVPCRAQNRGKKTGVVCIWTVPEENAPPPSAARTVDGPTYRTFKYVIQIDSQKVAVSTTKSIPIKGLAMNARHLVKIFLDGRPVESFHFTFEKVGSDRLCMWFKSMYDTWSLSPVKGASKMCGCK